MIVQNLIVFAIRFRLGMLEGSPPLVMSGRAPPYVLPCRISSFSPQAVRAKIRRGKGAPFNVSQDHRNRHASIGYR